MTAATFQEKATVSSAVRGHTARLARSLSGDPGAARSYARRQAKRSSSAKYDPATKRTDAASSQAR
uniref:Uncharacterized protein n=1 Tax=Arundo donax TaxID=35708 RepID=A0A0A9N3A9_ARUDO